MNEEGVMGIDAFERRGETFRLRAKLEAAEQSSLHGEPTYSAEESLQQLEAIYARDDV